MRSARVSVLGRWLTPRFPVEMAAASALTLGLVFVVGDLTRVPMASAPKVARQAAPAGAPSQDTDSAGTSDFIERFALAHVRAPLPESALTEPSRFEPARPDALRPLGPVRAAAGREKPRAPLAVVVKPAPRPANLAVAEVEPASKSVETPPPPQAGFRIPLVSDVAASVGRRIGAIFGRS